MLPICDGLQLHIPCMQHKDLLLYYQQSLDVMIVYHPEMAAINFLHMDYDILVLILHNYTLYLYFYLTYKCLLDLSEYYLSLHS